MYKLTVLLTLINIAVAKPSFIHGAAPVAYSVSVAAIPTAINHQYRADIISKPYAEEVVAAPVVKKTASYAAIPVISEVAPALAYASVPITRTAYTKKVDYVQKDVVTGYTFEVLKPNLRYLPAPLEAVSKSQVLTPARSGSVTPTVSQVKQEIKPKEVEVPLPTPAVREVEDPTSKLAQPTITYAAPALARGYILNVSPVVSGYSFATNSLIAPVATGYAANVAPLTYTSPTAATKYICNEKYAAAATAVTAPPTIATEAWQA